MATITYTDHEGGAPVITWHGREVTSTIPVEVDPETEGFLIEAAKENRFFEVDEGEAKAPGHNETTVGKGAAAARDGKRRLVPPSYIGDEKKGQAEAWVCGYD
ncbi:hypothetical protein, partial [Acinetobacter baumannii]|uniref:hypothetical protein n=1 Tax=Acinetobacter baumannii TaxID=470 RepID=UPI001897C09D